ncbi:MAG: hypothetical protein LBS81_02695 [Endomicrobium sp.]|nr:hypothetical protein [Endomicrobium sp.]
MVVLVVRRVKGGNFIGIIGTIIMGLVDVSKIKFFDLGPVASIKDVAFVAFKSFGMGSLFSDFNKITLTITATLALLLSVTFDGMVHLLGTERVSGLFGTSSVTTYVGSASEISVGGRTGLTGFVVSVMFLLCLPFANLFSIVFLWKATAPALIIVGVFMMTSIMNIDWLSYEQAFPAF